MKSLKENQVENPFAKLCEKVQVYPSKKFVIICDKLTNNIFNSNRKNSTEIDLVEDDFANIVTPVSLTLSSAFTNNHLTAFDHLIFDACVSEQEKGNEFTTPAIIYRAIGGEKDRISPTAQMKILNSIKKLATTWIAFDCSDICRKRGYNDGRGYEYNGSLLPLEFVVATVNGQVDTVAFHFLRKSPLLDVAKMKGQLITCDDGNLLKLPHLKNTERVLSIKGYLFRRVKQIIGSHQTRKGHRIGLEDKKPVFKFNRKLAKFIRLDTLFEQCELSDSNKWQQQDIRTTIAKVMEHFKANNLITEWHFEKKERKIVSISFDFK